MQLTIKTTGLLGKYLPDGSSRNKGVVELASGSTVRQLLDQLGIPDNGRCHVTLNGSLLQPDNWNSTTLAATDEIILMAPLSAG
jgi:thiamine biosynthesis protein ThiS